MLRSFVNTIIFLFAVIALAAVMLESTYADVVRFHGVRRAVAIWIEWTDVGWAALSDLIEVKIIAVFRCALALLILFIGLYISASGPARGMGRVQFSYRSIMVSFILAFSIVIVITFNDVMFAHTMTLPRVLQMFVGVLTAAISLAYALPVQPHLPVMTKGLWFAIAIWTVCIV